MSGTLGNQVGQVIPLPPAAAPPVSQVVRPSVPPAPVATPAPAAQATAPQGVTDILAQHDPTFDAFWQSMLPHESGGKDVPNYRYDPGHTASGYAQITDTNWKAYAPKLGIDIQKYPTAMSAPGDYQKAVAKLMHRAEGPTPWDAAHGGSLPVGGGALGKALMGAAGQETALYDKAANEMRSARQDAIKMLQSVDADAPDFRDRVRQATDRVDQASDALMRQVSQKPEVPTNQALAHFGSLGSILSIFAGMLSRNPAIGALTAAGSFVGAANEGDWNRYHAALESWKTQSEMMLQISKMQQERLQSIISDHNQDLNQRMARAGAFMRANEMGYMASELETKGPDALLRATEGWARLNEQMQQHYDMLQLRLATLGQKAAAQTGSKLDQDTLSSMADQYIAGDKSVLQGLGYGNAGAGNRVALRTEISKKEMARATDEFRQQHGRDPTEQEREGLSADIGRRLALSVAEYSGLQQAERTGYGRVAGLTIGAEEAKQFSPLALAASEKVNRTQYPTINKLELAAMEGSGNTDVINFVEANAALMDAYAQVIGRGNAQLTDAARDQAKGLLNSYWSRGQYATAVSAINREIEAALRAPSEMLQTFRTGFGVGSAGGLPDLSGQGSGRHTFSSAEDVRRAYQGGMISRDEAAKVLREKGWAQ